MGRTHTKPVVVVVEVVVVVTDRTARVDRSAPPPEGGALIIHEQRLRKSTLNEPQKDFRSLGATFNQFSPHGAIDIVLPAGAARRVPYSNLWFR